MYIPKHFDQPDVAAVHELILGHPLGVLVTAGPGGLSADHLPFELAAAAGPLGTLMGHVARANPVWRGQEGAAEVLVVFQGPDAYISPGWYPSKAAHGKVVPTWNYVVAHLYGRMRAVDDGLWLRDHVERLTAREESVLDPGWSVSDAPAEFIDKMLTAVVGIEIEVTRIEAKWKLSQNRPTEDRDGVVGGLRGQGTDRAEDMATYVEDARR